MSKDHVASALVVAALLTAVTGFAQGWPAANPIKWRQVKRQTHSSNWRVRAAAFDYVHDHAEKSDPEVAALLFELLARENGESGRPKGASIPEVEAWAEPYYTTLLEDCDEIFKARPTPERFRVLANGSFNPDSPFAQSLGARADGNVDWLAETLSKAANPYKRVNAAAILSHWIRIAKPEPGPGRAAAITALRAAVEDPHPDVSPQAAYVIGASRDRELCGVLKKATERWRARGKTTQYLERALTACAAP